MTNSFVLEDYIHIPDAPIIRVSVSNLVATINDEIIGMLNKWPLKRGIREVSCIGWSATVYNHRPLENIGAHAFEWEDARFRIPRETACEVVRILRRGDRTDIFEKSVLREVREELTEEIIGDQTAPMLLPSDMTGVQEYYCGTVYYSGHGTKAVREVPTLYIWRLFSLNVPDVCMRILLDGSITRRVDKEGILRGMTCDDVKIGPNMRRAYEYVQTLPI